MHGWSISRTICVDTSRFVELATEKLGQVDDSGWWKGSAFMQESQSYTRTFGAAVSRFRKWVLIQSIAC